MATDAGPGNIIIESSNGNPLQLLSLSGDVESFDVIESGIDYSLPANWQRLVRRFVLGVLRLHRHESGHPSHR